MDIKEKVDGFLGSLAKNFTTFASLLTIVVIISGGALAYYNLRSNVRNNKQSLDSLKNSTTEAIEQSEKRTNKSINKLGERTNDSIEKLINANVASSQEIQNSITETRNYFKASTDATFRMLRNSDVLMITCLAKRNVIDGFEAATMIVSLQNSILSSVWEVVNDFLKIENPLTDEKKARLEFLVKKAYKERLIGEECEELVEIAREIKTHHKCKNTEVLEELASMQKVLTLFSSDLK